MSTEYLTHQHQTRIAVQLVIEDDTGALAASLWLFISWWQITFYLLRKMVALVNELLQLKRDVVEAVEFTFTVLSIGLTALAFGFGVKR